MMRPEEFSLHLRWTPTVNGVRPTTPGFYVSASFANEGAAEGVVRGSWAGGVAGPGSLAGRSFLEGLTKLLAVEDLLDRHVSGYALGNLLADATEKAQTERVVAQRARLAQLRAEVAALEAQVG